MTETTTPVEETSSSSIQPGVLTAKLTACREKAGLDIEQAADEMHLSVNLLRALEQEDFVHLPEPPYIRGYLRGYAKLADTDPSDLIRTYEALRGANPDEIAHHFSPVRSLGKVTEPSVSPTVIKFIGIVLLAGIIGLIAMIPAVRDWASSTWASLSAQTTPPQVVRPAPALQTFTAAQDAEEKSQANENQATATPPNTPKPEDNQQARDENKPTDNTSGTAQEKPVTPAASPVTATADTDKPAIATDNGNTGNKSADTETSTDKPTTTDATTDLATPVQPINGEVNVKLEFNEEVWMQIKDDKKKVLFESLNSAGTTKEFKANTPLNFKIGNARGVKVYLNGQLYDQAAHTKGSVARFKVE